MFNPRNVILAALAVVLCSLTWSVIGMLGPPDSDGLADDSYGTRSHGQRGLYETLAHLGVPVSRSLAPPNQSLPRDTTLVLWDPRANLVSFEPRFLSELGQWVRDGGRVVVTPPIQRGLETLLTPRSEFPVKDAAATLWESLGLEGLKLTTSAVQVESAAADSEATTDPPPGGNTSNDAPTQPLITDVDAAGSLATLAGDVRRLATPFDSLETVDIGEGEARGRITGRDDDGDEYNAVVCVGVGQGEVIVVGDPRLFSNLLLARADNSILAVRLLMGDRPRVEFNEFYHGLSVRGNPLWLFTRRGYALIATVIVAVVAVVTWRSAVLLGPPLTMPQPSRRTVAEYIDAMSRFLNRGHRTRSQLLQAVFAGTLRRLAAEFSLTHNRENANAVVAAVARRDPNRAVRLREASQAVDAVLAKHDKATEKETVQALRQLQDCLSENPVAAARV